jgi:hypothetical protein
MYRLKGSRKIDLMEPPPLHLKFSYQDIGGQVYEEHFHLKLSLIMFTPSPSEFLARLEVERLYDRQL